MTEQLNQGSQRLPSLYNATRGQVAMTVGAFAVSGLFDVALHNPSGFFLVVIGATGMAGYLSNDVLDMIVPGRSTARVVDATVQAVEALAPVEEDEDPFKDQSARAKIMRLLGRRTPPLEYAPGEQSVAAAARPKFDPSDPSLPQSAQAAPAMTKRSTRPGMIDLAPDLQVEKEALIGKAIFVCGIRRHGKTTLGARLAEQMGKHYIPMLIPDLEGDYLSLADILPRAIIAGPSSRENQSHRSYFAGLDTPEQAFSLGYDLLECGYQVILDMTAYDVLDKAVSIQVNLIRGMFKWANDHPDTRVPSYVYLDEAQRFLPQTLNDSVIQDKTLVAALLRAYMDIIAIGGKRGISPLVLTQRFAQVNNKIMAQSEVFFLMRQTHDTDLKRCMEYANAPITSEQISKFERGEGIYIATDGSQIVTHFHQRESDGSRSTTPKAEQAQRYAAMPLRSSPPSMPLREQRANLPERTPRGPEPPRQKHDMSGAIKNMRAAGYEEQDILRLVGMSRSEYRQVAAEMETAPAQRPLRRDEEPAHDQNSTRTALPSVPNLTLIRREDDRDQCAQESAVRPDERSTQTTHNDAYPQLNQTQIALFAKAYEMTGNIDKSLKFCQSDSRYRHHARIIIRDLQLKKREA